MTDCDKFMENKDLTKVVYRKGGAKRGKVNRKKRTWCRKHFQSLHVASLMHTRASSAIECGHLPHQVRSLKCYFQKPPPEQQQGRVICHDGVHSKHPHTTYGNPRGQKHSSCQWNELSTVFAHKPIKRNHSGKRPGSSPSTLSPLF